MDKLDKEKYVFYDEHGNTLSQKTIVDDHIQGCKECCEVQAIKTKAHPPISFANPLFRIPEAIEHEVLLFADKKHQGFAAAYTRVKNWADFPNFKEKVFC